MYYQQRQKTVLRICANVCATFQLTPNPLKIRNKKSCYYAVIYQWWIDPNHNPVS